MSDFWSQTKATVLASLHTNEHHGLSNEEAANRLRRYGYNALQKTDRPSVGLVLLGQLNSPFVYILMVAALITGFEGQWTELLVIGLVVVVNATVGFYEEYNAEQTISKLRSIIAPMARVVRQSIEQKIPARLLVPGDIILVAAGDRVPADARILDGRAMGVNQASLTGEAYPQRKRDTIVSAAATLFDRQNMLFLSTLVVSGQATAVVVRTGMQTELGSIAREVVMAKEQPTDLTRKLKVLGMYLTLIAAVLAALVFLIGFWAGSPALEMFRTTLSLLVSIVPEGLPIALTVALAIGLTRLFRRHVLVRRLGATETLGSVTTLCIDKTGTLTEGAMMVEKVILPGAEFNVSGKGFSLTGSFYQHDQAVDLSKTPELMNCLELTGLATMSTIAKEDLLKDRARSLTDPTETALAVVAAKGGIYAFDNERQHPELLELPFDQDLRYSASVHRFGDHYRVIAKGSLERIISLSDYILDKKSHHLLKEAREKLIDQGEALAAAGYRVVALAYTDRPTKTALDEKMVHGLTFVGLLALADPIRLEAKLAIEQAATAGVRTIMITGDHLLTATHIAKKLGLDRQGEVIHAQDLAHHDLSKVAVIARATPHDKLVVVERLQRNGEIVAMTGDGVNDAPALKRADIGVALGRTGSDIAVEAADIVLLDDNVDGLIRAVTEGRLIWENVKKVVYYLISTNLGEVLTIIGAIMLGWPVPLLAVQILWLNLVTDGVTSMALTVESAEEDLMARPPRQPKEPIISRSNAARMVIVSVVMMAGALFVYHFYQADPIYARSATLTTLVFFQLFNLFNSRSAARSIFSKNWANNRLLLWLFLLAASLQLVALYWPILGRALGLTSLDLPTLILCLTVALSIVVVDELRKLMRGGILAWAKTQTTWN